jgi:hypothetical protein
MLVPDVKGSYALSSESAASQCMLPSPDSRKIVSTSSRRKAWASHDRQESCRTLSDRPPVQAVHLLFYAHIGISHKPPPIQSKLWKKYPVRHRQLYAARRRRGEAISTAFVESAVNEIVAKRMNKKQQMRWNRATVQPFLDVRTAVLNEALENAFRHRYPSFRSANNHQAQSAAA